MEPTFRQQLPHNQTKHVCSGTQVRTLLPVQIGEPMLTSDAMCSLNMIHMSLAHQTNYGFTENKVRLWQIGGTVQ